jgi:hypothetical protein
MSTFFVGTVIVTLLCLLFLTMSLVASRLNPIAAGSKSVFAKQKSLFTARRAPSNRTVCMATSKDGQKLDKSTPDSVWKTILDAEEVSKDVW